MVYRLFQVNHSLFWKVINEIGGRKLKAQRFDVYEMEAEEFPGIGVPRYNRHHAKK